MTFQSLLLAISLATAWSYNPHEAGTSWVWAIPRSLATTYGIIVYFLFLRVLRCFSSPRSPPQISGYQACSLMGCPIRKSPGQWIFAPYRGLSQLITSFIACKSQGIHRTPFPTFFYRFGFIVHTPWDSYPWGRYVSFFPGVMNVIITPVGFLRFACCFPICQRSFTRSFRVMWRITDSNR